MPIGPIQKRKVCQRKVHLTPKLYGHVVVKPLGVPGLPGAWVATNFKSLGPIDIPKGVVEGIEGRGPHEVKKKTFDVLHAWGIAEGYIAPITE